MKCLLVNKEMAAAILDGRKTQTRRVIKGVIENNGNFAYKDPKKKHPEEGYKLAGWDDVEKFTEALKGQVKPQYEIGDILWMREPAKILGNHKQTGNIYDRTCDFKYIADDKIVRDFKIPHRVSSNHINSFMYPRYKSWLVHNKGVPNGCLKEMARVFLKVTGFRIERLQDISDNDCLKEGIYYTDFGTYIPKGEASIDGGKTFHPFKPRQHRGWNYGKATNPDQCLATQRSAFYNLWDSCAKIGFKCENKPFVFVYEFEICDSPV